MRTFIAWSIVLACLAPLCVAAGQEGEGLYQKPGSPPRVNRIDELIFARLDAEKIQPAGLCSDSVFIRRAYLDVIGTLPTVEETRTFLADEAADKRARLIDSLLDRPEFVDYWTLRWCDVLRVKSEFPINLWPNAVQAYHRWVHDAVRTGMPYDRFARELLTSSGSNFRVPAVNFYRATQSGEPASLAKAACQTFLGDRMDHWPADRAKGFANFFARIGFKSTREWKEQIVYFDRTSPPIERAVLPDGSAVKIPPGTDPRVVLAEWLVDQPGFAQCHVNRIWFWLLGRGLVEEPDDFRPDNPPSHPELLAWLGEELVKAKFDTRHVYRLILNSSTYQLAPVARGEPERAYALFAAYRPRRMDAEVLIDAICQITGTSEEYHSKIPEPFTWVPTRLRSIALPDGSITSPFLDMFGRPPRDTGLAGERSNTPEPAQQLHLLNSSHVWDKIRRGPAMRQIGRMGRSRRGGRAMAPVEHVYLMTLCRLPSPAERETIAAYAKTARGGRRGALADLVWALVNSPEFLLKH